MDFKKLIDGVLCADPFDLLIWLQWYISKDPISCRDCLLTRKDQSGTPPNCVACGLPQAKLKKSIFKETN